MSRAPSRRWWANFRLCDFRTLARNKIGITFLRAVHLPQGWLRMPTTCMKGCKGEASTSRLWRSSRFASLRDDLQDNTFSSAFVQLDNLSAVFIGLQEFGLANIFLQFFESEHSVLAWIQPTQAKMAAPIGRTSLVKIRP